MAITVLRPTIDEFRRIIVIGDINGNDEAFTRLLAKLRYTRNDILIILGNMIEKGPDSLRTLRHIMELSTVNPVYTVLGDRDTICKELLRNDRNEQLLSYVLSKKSGLVWDMCQTSNIPLKPNTNMFLVKQSLRVLYEREIAFICALPHVVELKNFVFAHAQVLPGELENMKPSEAIRADAFLNKGFSFERYVVVGHWPVCLYNTGKRDQNPVINRMRKIISMNGGISEHRDGQLNALVIPNASSVDFKIYYEDNLPKGRILNSQPAGEFCNNLCAPDNQVRLLRRTADFAYCKQDKTDINFWIPAKYITMKDGQYYSDDITDYQIRVNYDDKVSIIEETTRGFLIKKDGVTGWYYGLLEPLGSD